MQKGSVNPHLYKARVGNCLVCGTQYRATGDYGTKKQKYCSPECAQKAWRTAVRPKIKASPGKRGVDNPEWKGDDVGYDGLHRWVGRVLGNPTKCDLCGSEDKKKYEWCNKDHKYRRDIEDWIRLCTSCHRNYDKNNGVKINQWATR